MPVAPGGPQKCHPGATGSAFGAGRLGACLGAPVRGRPRHTPLPPAIHAGQENGQKKERPWRTPERRGEVRMARCPRHTNPAPHARKRALFAQPGCASQPRPSLRAARRVRAPSGAPLPGNFVCGALGAQTSARSDARGLIALGAAVPQAAPTLLAWVATLVDDRSAARPARQPCFRHWQTPGQTPSLLTR